MKIRRTLALVLAIVTAFSLAACGNAEPAGDDGSEAKTEIVAALNRRLLQIMCKPPEWCKIEASHRRLYICRPAVLRVRPICTPITLCGWRRK